MPRLPSAVSVFPILLLAVACGRGGSSGSPTCGIALLAGPSLIVTQLANARAVVADPPRGLPDSLPARVIEGRPGSGGIGAVIAGRDAEGKISMQYRGPGFPSRGYGILVVDDTSQRAMGVLILDQEEPQRHPIIGTIIGSSVALNLYGVRVDWSNVSNPRCPLFGAPATSGT